MTEADDSPGHVGMTKRRAATSRSSGRHPPAQMMPMASSLHAIPPRGKQQQSPAIYVLATLLFCLVAYGLMSYRTAPDFNSAIDLEAKYHALLAAHEETARTVEALKKDALLPASKVDSSLSSLQEDLRKLSDAVEHAERDRLALLKAQADMQESVKRVQTDTKTQSQAIQKKAEDLKTKTEEHLAALQLALDALQREFEAIKSKDFGSELAGMRDSLVQEAIAEVLKELKSEQELVTSSVEKTSASILKSVKKDLMTEVKKEVDSMLLQKVSDQVAEAIREHKGASSLLAWFDTGKGKLNDERMELAVKSVLAKLYSERLGRVDWLLGVNGARIESSSDTNCNGGSLIDTAFCKLAPSLSAVQLNSASFLQGDVQTDTTWLETSAAMLGNCWAMEGSTGHVIVAIAKPIRPTEFVVQHAPVSISVDKGKSAPRRFRIKGRLAQSTTSGGKGNDTGGLVTGTWAPLVDGEYLLTDVTADSTSLTPHMQNFQVESSHAIDAVRFEVLDNHGSETFTCLYHLRMYGDP